MALPLSLLSDTARPTLLVLSQVYVPDTPSVGQHMHDVSREMVRRGMRVIVVTSDRGYEDPSQRFARYEQRDGVDIVRVPFASFGKGGMRARLAGASVFLAEATGFALGLQRVDRMLISTSPPMCAAAGLAISRAKRVPFAFWVMDLNPDQIVASGGLSSDASLVRALDWLNQQTFARAGRIFVLDRFMAERVRAKGASAAQLVVLPPWPHGDAREPSLPHAQNPFRRTHAFGAARVVMYSGNLSPIHPITTLLEAARRLRDDSRLRFVFVGGGLGRDAVERESREHRLANIRTLPYQPLSELRQSLSAADVHVVSMGSAMVGIVHPCKIYGAMAVARPIFALAPETSHVAELVRSADIGWCVAHADVSAAVRTLREIAAVPDETLAAMGGRAQDLVRRQFDRNVLIAEFCDALGGAWPHREGLA